MNNLSSPNWNILASKGVEMESPLNKSVVRVRHLDFDTALRLGHALTIQLDSNEACPQYDKPYFSYEKVVRDALERIAQKRSRVFGETRPARAKFAVRVDKDLASDFLLYADIRNQYEDKPELGGGDKLQQAFIATVESLDLH